MYAMRCAHSLWWLIATIAAIERDAPAGHTLSVVLAIPVLIVLCVLLGGFFVVQRYKVLSSQLVSCGCGSHRHNVD